MNRGKFEALLGKQAELEERLRGNLSSKETQAIWNELVQVNNELAKLEIYGED